eukprot:6825116-Prymnesium_polylepis.1
MRSLGPYIGVIERRGVPGARCGPEFGFGRFRCAFHLTGGVRDDSAVRGAGQDDVCRVSFVMLPTPDSRHDARGPKADTAVG